MKRKEFLQYLSSITASILVSPEAFAKGPAPKDKWGEILPQRLLGRTGEKVTMLGVGGSHVGWQNERDAQAIIEKAMEGGIRFFDNAESYAGGGAERHYGKFLVPKYRDDVFIMTKTTSNDAQTAQRHLEGSLSRLNTDYLDLWQIHSVKSPNEVDRRVDDGVLEYVLKAQEEGKVRYVGFTGHTRTSAHLQMLERAGQKLQTCQMPINVADPAYDSFIMNVIPKLQELNYGIIAMKTLANGGFFGGRSHGDHGDEARIIPEVVSIQEAVHFAWSLPISTLVTGAEDTEMLQQKIDYAHSFKNMDENQRKQLIDKVADIAQGGELEFYKA